MQFPKTKTLGALTGLLPLSTMADMAAVEKSAKVVPIAERSIGVGAGELSQTAVGLAVIVSLLFLGSFFLKRFKLLSPALGGEVRVINQIPLSAKEKLLVLQVGEEKILVGNGGGNMRTLHRWASPAGVGEDQAATPVFARLLNKSDVTTRTKATVAKLSAATGQEQQA